VADGTVKLGAILTGKTLPENVGGEVLSEVQQRLGSLGLSDEELSAALQGHKNATGEELQTSAIDLFTMAQEAFDMSALHQKRDQTRQQALIAETLRSAKSRKYASDGSYPYEGEKELIAKVQLGDRHSAKGILNEILGKIIFQQAITFVQLKARMIELLAVLSRAAADAGVDVDKALERNPHYFQEIINADSETALCQTISKALNEFLDTVCVSSPPYPDGPVEEVVQYIEHNFARELCVNELARHVHLSPSRISHVFQEKTGTTMMQTLLRVRINESKRLLIQTNQSCTDIAFAVGFRDLSYFTRMFRKLEKVTPKKFRIQNRNLPAAQTLMTVPATPRSYQVQDVTA
jgi:two-component system, response regulator YesN